MIYAQFRGENESELLKTITIFMIHVKFRGQKGKKLDAN